MIADPCDIEVALEHAQTLQDDGLPTAADCIRACARAAEQALSAMHSPVETAERLAGWYDRAQGAFLDIQQKPSAPGDWIPLYLRGAVEPRETAGQLMAQVLPFLQQFPCADFAELDAKNSIVSRVEKYLAGFAQETSPEEPREPNNDAARYRWLRDWYRRGGKRSEIDPDGHIAVRTLPEWEVLLDAAIARSSSEEPESLLCICADGWCHDEVHGPSATIKCRRAVKAAEPSECRGCKAGWPLRDGVHVEYEQPSGAGYSYLACSAVKATAPCSYCFGDKTVSMSDGSKRMCELCGGTGRVEVEASGPRCEVCQQPHETKDCHFVADRKRRDAVNGSEATKVAK
jgi:hypothetical protein